jgi:hypothetical protein
MSEDNRGKPASALGRDAMKAIGGELRPDASHEEAARAIGATADGR